MGWFGGNDAEEKNMERQHEYDMSMYQYNIHQRDDKYEFALDQFEIKQWNAQQETDFKNETAKNEWIYKEKMREFDYNNQIAAYNASVENYERQMEFNEIASEITTNDHTRKYNEQLIGIGFQKEELMNKFGWETEAMSAQLKAAHAQGAFKGEEMKINMLQKSGKVAAMGGSGRSARKLMQSVMADFGRNQQILADSITRDEQEYEFGLRKAHAQMNLGKQQLHQSMKSAKAQYESDIQHTTLQKYKADMAAENAIAPEPVLPPAMPAPLEMPTPRLLAPKEPTEDPPKPVKGAVPQQSLIGQVFQFLSDDRVKYDITRVGTSPSGIPEYTFKYRFDGEHGPTYKGTSAQDLMAMGRNDAVTQPEKDGFYRVDYSKLDVKMEKIQTV